MVDEALRSVAENFWAQVGESEPYPRNLEASVLWALPVAISKSRDLSVDSVEGWLRRQDVPFGLGCHDRNLRACIVSYGGTGLIFLDATDSEDELRFSLAHEVSHFLLDYLLPRRRAISALRFLRYRGTGRKAATHRERACRRHSGGSPHRRPRPPYGKNGCPHHRTRQRARCGEQGGSSRPRALGTGG